ncbi:MAG TPA: molecular chaperone DnaK, partial [Anaerolineales bacterium]|nr:molecular chaperone DnaK [Anaerolineales bacterium]
EINLPFITADSSGPKHLQMKLTRARLEQLTEDLVERSLGPCKQALADARLKPADIDQVILVGGQTRMPAIQRLVAEFFEREPHKGVNPDEVVGIGAAIQAGVLAGEVKDVLLLDVTPLTLSIETLGGVATPLIERNTTIPTRKGQIFSTATDGQTQVEIHVVQGERPMAVDNKSLGRFILDGIPPAPRGVPQIEVTFDIDADGILNVSAKDKATGREQSMRIIPSSGLTDEEVERMVREAEELREQDRRRKDLAEARNAADNAVYSAEKFLREMGEQIPADTRRNLEEKTRAVREVLSAEDAARIRQRTAELGEAIQAVGARMYQGAGPSTPPPSGEEGEGDVIEGEFSTE